MTDATTEPDLSSHMGRLAARREGERLELAPSGSWTAATAARLDGELRAVDSSGATAVRIDLAMIQAFDTAGAWLLHRAAKGFRGRGLAVEIIGARAPQAALLETVATHTAGLMAAPRRPAAGSLVERLGRGALFAAAQGRDLVDFLGLVVVTLGRILRHPRRLPRAALVTHMERAGLDAMPIVGLLSLLVGVVLAYQGAAELARFGAEVFTANLVGLGILREMGILLTAIIVAGRSGSAFTAQIGTMEVNEEIDAMRTIGVDPVETLVLPRLVALVLVAPLLTLFADVMGLLGGALTATVALDLTLVRFAEQVQSLSIRHFWVGIVKAPLFAFIIASCGCFEGLRVARNAASVGLQTTRAVVESIVLVIALDALLSVLFAAIGV